MPYLFNFLRSFLRNTKYNIYKAPSYLKIESGNYQIGTSGQQLANPIEIGVYDSKDKLVKHLPVPIHLKTSEGSFINDVVYSQHGIANACWILGSDVGEQTMKAYFKDGEEEKGEVLINATADESSSYNTGTVSDYESNVYKTVKIGEQWWMAENLKSTVYADGTSIPNIQEDNNWVNLGDNNIDKAYCFYNNDSNFEHGALYTYAAATNGSPYVINTNTQGVCPNGWHLPNNDEWIKLINFLITNGYNYDGTTIDNKIGKSLAFSDTWKYSTEIGNVGNNQITNNKTVFFAIPTGRRSFLDGAFILRFENANWWSSTEVNKYKAYFIGLAYHSPDLYYLSYYKSLGFSVRCIKDN